LNLSSKKKTKKHTFCRRTKVLREENECVHPVKIKTFIRRKKTHRKIHIFCRRKALREK